MGADVLTAKCDSCSYDVDANRVTFLERCVVCDTCMDIAVDDKCECPQCVRVRAAIAKVPS